MASTRYMNYNDRILTGTEITKEHESAIKRFLYDEGPKTCAQIAAHLELTEERTKRILELMGLEGILHPERLKKIPGWSYILDVDIDE